MDFSRREFLNLSGLALAGMLIPARIGPKTASSPVLEGQQVRVVEPSVVLYRRPSFDSLPVKTYWQDAVLPVSQVTVGAPEPAHNRVWYRIAAEGYVHSGTLQPVRTQLNPVVTDLPEQGQLAEVSVPFTDAHWRVGRMFPVAYRLYYQTTHWVIGTATDGNGETWYHLQDDKWEVYYYAPARHLRLIPDEELAPLSPEVPSSAKRVEVNRGAQAVIAYEYDRPVFMARTATGARFSNGDFTTRAGRYSSYHKRPYRHMAAGNLAHNGYDLPGVPWVIYITESGISFHGTYWHNNFGRPRSHGCINLTPQAAKWLYRWTTPAVPPQEQLAIDSDNATRVEVI